MNLAMQLNLSKSISHPNQSFANTLLDFGFLGSIHPRHMNDANGRCRTNIWPLIRDSKATTFLGGLRFGAPRLTI